MSQNVLFEFNKSFIQPNQIPALAQAFDFGLTRSSSGTPAPRTDRFLLIIGHTDRAGTPQYNQQLSERRARAVWAVFSLEPSIWENLYGRELWGDEEIRTMSESVDLLTTDRDIARYHSDSQARLELIERYLNFLRPDWLPGQSPPIEPSTVASPSPPLIGCGENHPQSNAQQSRRVEFFYFRTSTPGVSVCPSQTTYNSWQTTCGLPPISVQVELVNDCGNPFSGSFDLTLPNGGRLNSQQTNDRGIWERENLSEGQYTLTVGRQSMTKRLSSTDNTIQLRIWRSITVRGTSILRAGSPLRFFGTNAYYLMKEAASAGLGTNSRATVPQQIRDFFSLAQASGLKVVRIWGFYEHQSFGQAARTQRDPGTSGGSFQLNPESTGLNALEWVIDEAERHSLYLIVTLGDYWNWEGGIRQYAHWADRTVFVPQGERDREKPDYLVEEIFFKGTKNGQPLTLDPRQLYRDYACHVIGRFRDRPNILAWELMNEPGIRQYNLPEGQSRSVSIQDLMIWIRDTVQHIRSTCNPAPQLLSVGGIHANDLSAIFADSTLRSLIDLMDTHLYPVNHGLNPIQANQALTGAVTLASGHQKPFYLGEFGIKHNSGRTRHQEYQDWTTTLRTRGASGLLFWQLLPQSRTAYDHNEIHVAPGTASTQPLQAVPGERREPTPGIQAPSFQLPDANQVVGFVNNALNTWQVCP